jgi:plastocyanin
VNRRQILIIIILIFTIQCSLLHKHQVPSRPIGEMAVLQTSSKMDVFVYSVDEKRVAQGDDIRYEFEPGVHTISLRFRKKKTSSEKSIPSSIEFDLSIDAMAGKTYQIKHEKNDNYSKWSTCIIDASNNNRVSSIMTNED